MRLQIVGELLKKVQKLGPFVFEKYPEIEWQNIMKLRDIISHLGKYAGDRTCFTHFR